MQRRCLWQMGLAMVLLAFAVCPAWGAAVGQVAPGLAANDAQGVPFDLARLRGQVVYLDFWASWCVPCRKSFPFMNDLVARHVSDGLAVVAVNVDGEAKDAAAFLARYPASFTVLYDSAGKAPTAWGVVGMPSSFLIDRHGAVRAAHVGFHDDSPAKLGAEIDALLKEK